MIIIQNIVSNSMTEQQGASQYSMATTEEAKSYAEQGKPVLAIYLVPIVLVLLGFYFLVFAIVELVTNYSDHSYETAFTCTEFQCTARFRTMSFPVDTDTYIYISNSKFSQSMPSGVENGQQDLIDGCLSLNTNSQANKNISMTGSVLGSEATAYPCGQTAMHYPGSNFTIKNTDTAQYLTIKTDSLVVINRTYENKDQSTQWTDVTSERFRAWMEVNVAKGLNKYWGYIQSKVPENIQIVLTSPNYLSAELRDGLTVRLSDNQSLSGSNLPLCTFNFIWSFILFVLGCLSFWITQRYKPESSQMEMSEIQSSKSQAPQYFLKINS